MTILDTSDGPIVGGFQGEHAFCSNMHPCPVAIWVQPLGHEDRKQLFRERNPASGGHLPDEDLKPWVEAVNKRVAPVGLEDASQIQERLTQGWRLLTFRSSEHIYQAIKIIFFGCITGQETASMYSSIERIPPRGSKVFAEDYLKQRLNAVGGLPPLIKQDLKKRRAHQSGGSWDAFRIACMRHALHAKFMASVSKAEAEAVFLEHSGAEACESPSPTVPELSTMASMQAIHQARRLKLSGDLLATGELPLVEVNHHKDIFFGATLEQGEPVGRNKLGSLLQECRGALALCAKPTMFCIKR